MSTTPQVELDCQVTERGGGLFVNWDAVEDLFPAGVLDAMFDAYVQLVDRLVAGDWDSPVDGSLPASQAAARAAVNATAGPLPAELLHEAFFARAAAAPGRVALVWDGEPGTGAAAGSWSYGELADRALRVAGQLAARGIGPGDAVGVSVPRGPEQVAAVLGVLAAGGAYVPVGVDQPVARRVRVLTSAGVRAVVTGAAQVGELSGTALAGVPVLTVRDSATAAPLSARVRAGPDAVAYVIYTSGSTGEPKGVEIAHRAARNTVADVCDRYRLGEADRAVTLSSADFDLSVFDLFGLLSVGGSLLVVGEADRREASRWVELVRRYGVTVWNSVPALVEMALVAGAGSAGWASSLRLVLASGDWVAVDLATRLREQAPGARLVALGGATEVSIWSNAFDLDRGFDPTGWRSAPYGHPLRNQAFRVVDGEGRDRPDWVPGELWIGGAGVAAGYRGDPGRTAERFVAVAGGPTVDPSVDSGRWYRTGDLGRYRPGGLLEFLGRRDAQVKLGGHRIELGEVEAALATSASVERAVAAVTPAPGRRLVALVTPRPGGADPDPRDLREHCAQLLPAYMVPDAVAVAAAVPLTANGKLDRSAVGRLLLDGSGTDPQPALTAAPRGEIEETVAELWAELLQHRPVARTDSFFALGGDSLLATRLLSRLRDAGLEGGRLSELLSRPMLADFAAGLSRAAAAPGPLHTLRPNLADRYEPFPPTDVQRAYWVGRTGSFALGGVGSHWYWELDGAGVDLDRLEAAWNALVERHEMLRAVFDDDGNQRILPVVPATRFPVTEVEPAEADAVLAALRDRLSHRVADPARWPLVEVHAVRYGERTRLAFSFDYMVLDALSIVIVLTELSALCTDPAAVLPPAGMSFRDYVLDAGPDPAEAQAAQEYWAERAAGLPGPPRLPLAADPAQLTAPRFSRREARWEGGRWGAFVEHARSAGTTPAAALAAAYAEVLGAWSESDQLTLNLTLFDRRRVHPDVDATLGDFTSLLLGAYRPVAGETFAEAAARFQRQMWSDMDHRAVSALWVLRERARQTGSTDVAMPVVFTSALGLPAALVDLRLPFGEPVWGLSQTPQVWLDCQVTERAGGLSVNWDAVEDLFPPGVLDAMFAAYVELVDRLAAGDWSRARVAMPADQAATRAAVNGTAGPLPATLLHAGVLEQAAREPSRVALRWDGLAGAGSWSYGELADRALRVAGLLVASGVRAGDAVGVSVPRGPEQVAALLGVLAAGAAYVPVSVDQPVARRVRVLASAGAGAVLAGAAEVGELVGGLAGIPVLPVEEAVAATPLRSVVPVDADGLAYVIYTSGSTGEPKGVEIPHRAARNTVSDICSRYGIGPDDRALALSSVDFDLSVFDVFGLLSVGASLVLVPDADRREAARWVRLVAGLGVTVWNSVPALLEMALVAGTGSPGWADTLRLALVSGDWVPVDLRSRLREQARRARLVALGGATEASIWSNAFEVGPGFDPAGWRSVPYGRPLRNQAFRVVDEQGRDRPDWAVGELWIGGAGVAAGYRNDPGRTSERFVTVDCGPTTPTVGRGRWYRTGDLGRYRPGGLLEFLGRRDAQVKLGGYRVELGEVEAALNTHPAVDRAVAAATDPATGSAGGRIRRLAALVTPDPTRPRPDPDELRRHCTTLLPAYMVPDQVRITDTLPLTANGKVDRTAVGALLAAPADGAAPADPAAAPHGPVECALAAIWAELLRTPAAISRTDNFFALGGDSLLATRLVEAIRRELAAPVSLRLLLDAPTLTQLAELVAARAGPADPDLVEDGVI